ncbi:MAG TPA: SRPBCC domain-containing protein [Patescibacteria group bacterium]|nr:SRPBCC domain-containing protein [Patescibacteria group bacterium]
MENFNFTSNNQGIKIERIFDAPRELVFKAWTDPEIIKKWWGPEHFTAPSIKVDLQVGGKYIYAMHGPAGTEFDRDMYSAGVFKEIVTNEKLVVTDYFSDKDGNMIVPADEGMDANFPKESIVTVLFEEIGSGKTKLSIIYAMPTTDEQQKAMLASGMREGWQTSLDKLEAAIK